MFARLTQHGRSHVTSTASSPNRRPAAQRGVRLVAALASTLSVLALSAGTAAADSTYLKVIGPGGNQVPG